METIDDLFKGPDPIKSDQLTGPLLNSVPLLGTDVWQEAIDQFDEFAETETNADVARIAWREPGGKAWREATIDRFERASAVELWAGRAVPSRHNASAPDMRFSDFNAAAR